MKATTALSFARSIMFRIFEWAYLNEFESNASATMWWPGPGFALT